MSYTIEWPHPTPDMRGFAEPESAEEQLCDALVVLGLARGFRHFRVTVDFAAEPPVPTVHFVMFYRWWELAFGGYPPPFEIGKRVPVTMIDGRAVSSLRVLTSYLPEPLRKPWWRYLWPWEGRGA